MEFTTEKRRTITSSILETNELIDQTSKFSNNINAGYGIQVVKDKTNRELYRTINSQLTGFAYEYKYMTGKYHPQLEEIKYTFTKANDTLTEFTEEEYYDSPKLQSAGSLEDGNEFHLNLREDTTTYYPERPLKYSRWTDDDHDEVTDYSPTEEDLFNAIRSLISFYNNGGSGGSSEITIYGDYSEYIPGEKDMNQPYMTVGYSEYVTGGGVFMANGYDPVGDIILINPLDSNNYTFGKIISSKTEPSRILYAPYVNEGIIPKNSVLSSTYTIGNSMYPLVIKKLIDKLETIYTDILRYLNSNPEGTSVDNQPIMDEVSEVIEMITMFNALESSTLGDIIVLIDGIESKRLQNKQNRIDYIQNYLSTHEDLYEDRFKVLDMRLSKRMGTLREMMKAVGNIGEIFRISDEKGSQVEWLKKYFTVHKCESDGDYKRRVFVVDPTDDFSIGDNVYLLSDNEGVAEIYATIDVIVEARLEDILNSSYDESTGEMIKEYYSVKKLFFKDAWKNEEVKLKRFFPPEYKSSEGFRVIKQNG